MTETLSSGTTRQAEPRTFEQGPVRIRRLRPGPATATYIGVALCALGFAVLAFSWVQVAGQSEVFRQLPYLLSGGCVGLGVILVGVTTVNVAAKQADAAARAREAEQLTQTLAELRAAVEDVRG